MTWLVDLLFAALVAAAAGCGGWFLAYRSLRAACVREGEEARLRHTMTQLHSVVEGMAKDVVQHNTRVQAINDELLASESGQAPIVVQAVANLIAANEQMQRQLATAEQRLVEQSQLMERTLVEARTDALTGLANRREFDDQMARGAAEFAKRGRPLTVMLLDVDHFKKFNDTYGHLAGDEVLRGVARILLANVRQEYIVCRYGGEEFAVIFPGATLAEVRNCAERARAAIGVAVFEFEGIELSVTASAGVAQLQSGETRELLTQRADEALYEAKKQGRNNGHAHEVNHITPLAPAPAPAAPPAAPATVGPTVLEPSQPATVALDPREQLAPPAAPAIDKLTGMATATAFEADLTRRLAQHCRGGPTMSLVALTIDDYAAIVDEHGLKCGELVVKAVGQFLKATTREMDHIARLHEESFLLLLPTATLPHATPIAERLRGAIERCKLPSGGRPIQFTVSIGLAEAAPNDTSENLLARAELAQEAAVDAGGNCCYMSRSPGVVEPADALLLGAAP